MQGRGGRVQSRQVKLGRLRPMHLTEWITMLRKSGGHKGKPLSAKTVRHAVVLLNGALKWAVKMQLTVTNPLGAVGIPAVPRSQARALPPDEIAKVLAAAATTRWGPFVELAFATGMRRGELCALDWRSVDLERGTVLVDRSLTETRDGGAMKTTKTGHGRTVPLSRVAISALRKQRSAQTADRRRARELYDDASKAIFTDELGRRHMPMDATRAYGRIAKGAGVSSVRLHDARHTAATHLLVAGVDVRSVSGILGHRNAATTLGTYAHLIVDAQRDAVDLLGERLRRITNGKAPGGGRKRQPDGNRRRLPYSKKPVK